MAIDPRIAMQYQGFQMPSQTNALAKFLQLDQGFQQNALAKMQAEGLAEQRRLMIQKAQEELAQAAQARAAREALPSPADLAAQRAGGGPTVVAAQAQNRVDPRVMALFQGIRSGVIPVEKYAEITDPNFGRPKVARTIDTTDAQGRKLTRRESDFGDQIGNDLQAYVAPVQVNQGDRMTFQVPQAGVSLPVNMSPSERDSSARGWAGVKLQRDRLEFDKGGAIADAGGPNQALLVKQFGKPSAGYRWKQDGSQEPIPGGPADEKSKNTQIGKGSVSDVAGSLRAMYDQLEEGGGITSVKNGPIGNLPAGLSSSGPGQATGRLFGTQNQSLRNTIAQQRPILLQAIMKATGMSAKQMDSNAELKLYLATATDPTLDVEANRRALDMIEKLYGVGGDPNSKPAPSPAVDTAAGVPSVKPFGDPAMEAAYQAWKKGQQKK